MYCNCLICRAGAANLLLPNGRAAPGDRLPALWLIHDQFGEWMLTKEYKQEVAAAVQRLGVRVRVAGDGPMVFAAQWLEAGLLCRCGSRAANLGNRLNPPRRLRGHIADVPNSCQGSGASVGEG